MKISLAKSANSQCSVQFFFTKGQSKKVQFSSGTAKAHQDEINQLVKAGKLKGSWGEKLFFRNSVDGHQLLFGLGSSSGLKHEKARLMAASLYKKAKSEKLDSLEISVDQIPGRNDDASLVQALAEGFHLSAYSFDTFKAKKASGELTLTLTHKSPTATLKNALQDGEIESECVNFSRWLGDCPGNFMNPTQLATETQNKAKGTKLKVTAWNKARIAKEKMDSFIGVSNGSDQEPRFIIMEYKGAAASKKPICFVGKGLTFDAGGISIKPSAGMEEMKYDMCGGANVIGAMMAIAKLKLKVNAIGFVAASENMPGPSANKPGDIRKARNGKSIEIDNTDAEGRLILADALSYASEKKPAWIVDAATLTGAMMIALGKTHTGFFTRDEKMKQKMQKAAEASGERVWHMPLTDDHTNDMKGTYADLSNTGPNRFGGASRAAAFLENFVAEGIPWIHCDIAGSAWHVGNYFPYCPGRGASGAMVRTFVEMAKQHK